MEIVRKSAPANGRRARKSKSQHPDWCCTSEVMARLGIGHDGGEHRAEPAVASELDDGSVVAVTMAQRDGQPGRIVVQRLRMPESVSGKVVVEAAIEVPVGDCRALVRVLSGAVWAMVGSPLAPRQPTADDAPDLAAMLGTGV